MNWKPAYALMLANILFPITLELASTAHPLRSYAPLARILVLTAYFFILLLASRRVYASVLNTLALSMLTCEFFKTSLEFLYAGFLSAVALYFTWSRRLVALNLPREVEELRSLHILIKELRRLGSADKVPLFLSSASVSLSLIAMLYYLLGSPITPLTLLACLPLSIVTGFTLLVSDYSPRRAVELGFASGLSALALIPLAVEALQQAGRGEVKLTGREPSAMSLNLGRALAQLEYGIPVDEYKDFPQHWVSRSQPCWYWRRVRGDINLPVQSLINTHVVIAGASGTGKSLLAKKLVKEFSRMGKSVLITDPHGEYRPEDLGLAEARVVDASEIFLNPLDLGGLTPLEKSKEFSQTLAVLFGLGPLQRVALEDFLVKAYMEKGIDVNDPSTWSLPPPSLQDLEKACDEFFESADEFARICPYVKMLARHFPKQSPVPLASLLEKPVILRLNNVASDFSRTILVETLLYSILSAMYSRRLRDLVIVIDEVRAVLPGGVGDRILSRLFSESRKFGISLITISQDVKNIPRILLSNAGLKIFFNINEPESLEYAVKTVAGVAASGREAAVSTALASLKTLEFLLDVAGLNKVFITKTHGSTPT
ncbi:ATP-binding protein [Thermosphaera sp.]